MSRTKRLLAALVALVAVLAGDGPAAAQPTADWSIDFLMSYTGGRSDSAALVGWSSAGSVVRWELDADVDGVAVNWVDASGNMGQYLYLVNIADGQPRRVHLDAIQIGDEMSLTLTVAGTSVYPITVPGQIGKISNAAPSPFAPIRQATRTASVADLTAWNR